ncbi:MAG: glycosyltransferase [Lachnospiraceae bacterium]|nr:glycosyltransferase [Lachnospiraceae bacterium]
MKLLTATVPCYNSAAYMNRAIESLLTGGEDMEIIIVNDGSTDDTGRIADEYAEKYPSIIRVVHQENGGHGSAVNAGIREATGIYFKVVDSDDWVDVPSLQKVLSLLRDMVEEGTSLDLFIANYVYEKVNEDKKKVISYKMALPQDKVFGWDEVKHFRQGQYLLMHSVIYRTKLLRDCKLELPKHTFYVDNIFVYQPLIYVKTMYYMNVNLYRYFIGRDDQSVTEANMIKRIDQQIRVNKIMIDCYDIMQVKNKKLQNYLVKFMSIIMTVSSVYLIKEGSEESLKKKDELWAYLELKNKRLYREITHCVLGRSMNFKSKLGHHIVKLGYTISKKIYKFG